MVKSLAPRKRGEGGARVSGRVRGAVGAFRKDQLTAWMRLISSAYLAPYLSQTGFTAS